jgi:hypothetical protein
MGRPNLGRHYGKRNNSMTFGQAYDSVQGNPGRVYKTTGNDTPFTAVAGITTRGQHNGDPVIRFFSEGQERARAYECCWGHKTNCNRTHIDCYTLAL